MAITFEQLEPLSQCIRELTAASGREILCLGYPDILVRPSLLESEFDIALGSDVPIRPDSAEVLAWHGIVDDHPQLVESVAFFARLGLQSTIIDISSSRGGEQIHDLNLPLPKEFFAAFQIVIDAGTIEHCFNIGQAIVNAAGAVRPGGKIIHFSPISMFNHGFFNLNPTFFYDFYTQNEFEVETLKGVTSDEFPREFNFPPTERISGVPEDSSLLVVARRVKVDKLNWPTQTKYRVNAGMKS